MSPNVVVISSLSLTSIVFGIFLDWWHGSRLVFEVRDIWPLTMLVAGEGWGEYATKATARREKLLNLATVAS